jgi:hypothetical protein
MCVYSPNLVTLGQNDHLYTQLLHAGVCNNSRSPCERKCTFSVLVHFTQLANAGTGHGKS